MLVNQREKLRQERNGSGSCSCLAPANRHGLAPRREIKINDCKRLSLRDTNARVPKKPNDDSMLMSALRVE